MRNKKNDMSPEDFERFLNHFDPDPDTAGKKYLKLREKLEAKVRWFLDRRNLSHVDLVHLVDEALDRLARRLLEGEKIDSIEFYAIGICKYVCMEYCKKPHPEGFDENDGSRLKFERSLDQLDGDDPELECFKICWETALSPAERMLVEKYFDAQAEVKNKDNRKNLSNELRITYNNLKNKAKRLRDKLEACIKNCLREKNYIGGV